MNLPLQVLLPQLFANLGTIVHQSVHMSVMKKNKHMIVNENVLTEIKRESENLETE